MNNAKKKKTAAKRKQQKNILFSLTWGGMLSFAFLGGLALIWVFILGVIVGRGYHPEQFLPSIARFFPGASVADRQNRIAVPEDEVLQAKDLNFIEDLKKKVENQLHDSAPAAESDRAEDQGNSELPGVREPLPAPEYHCVYQVAAFKQAAPAKQVVSQLQGGGLEASVHKIQKSGQSWFRVYVSITGKEQTIRNFEERLARLGLKNAFLRKREIR